MHIVGWLLIAAGLLLVAVGIAILIIGAAQLFRQIFRPPTAAALGGAPAVNLADLAKLIEAIIKIPQWLLAILAGNFQIWLGYLLVTGVRLI
jgi:hypothetical protein